ncbi:unnamed protein product [Caenorhabditis auriculariae]|uniref:DNA repair metallo-beta-lactamase domain-containing protein n=1 Tax=Caenorhabditis auriculariae TaxID=2777116 RepID=A0A8S1HPL2_9PELO|nr:unnamed protein product [Caenorhabditis auriculariae]
MASLRFEAVLRSGKRLYTHKVTKKLIFADPRFKDWEDFWVIGCDINEPFRVSIKTPEQLEFFQASQEESTSGDQDLYFDDEDYVTVSFMPARHCLGSVMMLFEFPHNVNILYTGDFRLSAQDWQSSHFSSLRNPDHTLKYIKTIHFDSTFCRLGTHMIDREVSKQEVVNLCKEWLDESPKNIVLLWSYAFYGHEFLLPAIHAATGEKIHVDRDRFNVYKDLADIDASLMNSVTTECLTRIHACAYYRDVQGDPEDEEAPAPKKKKAGMPTTCHACRVQESNVRVIKVSMMSFAMLNNSTRVSQTCETSSGLKYYNVQYSCHASLREILIARTAHHSPPAPPSLPATD